MADRIAHASNFKRKIDNDDKRAFTTSWSSSLILQQRTKTSGRKSSSLSSFGIKTSTINSHHQHHHSSLPSSSSSILLLASNNDDNDKENVQSILLSGDDNDEQQVIIRGSESDNIDGSIWEDLETGRPPEIMVIKELLGINIFTYILAGSIVFFLGMNYFIGPGWLGSLLGIPGTGSINEVSDSIPDMVDLSGSDEYLLK